MIKYLWLFGLLFLFICLTAAAQAGPRIMVDLEKNTITINGTVFTSSSTIDDYEKLLGRTPRIEQRRGEDEYFIFDELGIAFSPLNDTDTVAEVYITYWHDGSAKLAKEPYKGILMINDKVISSTTTHKEVSKLARIELVEVMNGYFQTPNRALNVLMHYPESNYKKVIYYTFSFSASN